MLLVNINAHAQASAESLPAELSRVDFHLSHLYPIYFPICSRFREASTLQRTQNFVLASVFRSTIASLRSATNWKPLYPLYTCMIEEMYEKMKEGKN